MVRFARRNSLTSSNWFLHAGRRFGEASMVAELVTLSAASELTIDEEATSARCFGEIIFFRHIVRKPCFRDQVGVCLSR